MSNKNPNPSHSSCTVTCSGLVLLLYSVMRCDLHEWENVFIMSTKREETHCFYSFNCIFKISYVSNLFCSECFLEGCSSRPTSLLQQQRGGSSDGNVVCIVCSSWLCVAVTLLSPPLCMVLKWAKVTGRRPGRLEHYTFVFSADLDMVMP